MEKRIEDLEIEAFEFHQKYEQLENENKNLLEENKSLIIENQELIKKREGILLALRNSRQKPKNEEAPYLNANL